jgi:hypothetical protein
MTSGQQMTGPWRDDAEGQSTRRQDKTTNSVNVKLLTYHHEEHSENEKAAS